MQVKVGNVNQKIKRSTEDPRNISPNIAIVPRPSVENLLMKKKSRFT